MAGEEDSAAKPVVGRCNTWQKAVTAEEGSTNRTLGLCSAERSPGTECEDPILKKKANEEIHPSLEQDKEKVSSKSAIDEALAAAKLPKSADVVTAAASVMGQEGTKPTEPAMVDPEIAKAVSDPQAEAEAEIEAGFSEPLAEDQDGYYDGEAEDDYQYDDGYDGETEDDYDYGSDYESGYEDEDVWDWESEFVEQRPIVREVLLNFPEAAKLEPDELDAAVERILEQSKPENASVAASGKVRLSIADIQTILAQKSLAPIIHDLASQATLYPADLIRRREELDKEGLQMYEKAEEFQAKVRTDLIEKGYAEVDQDYYDNRDKFKGQAQEEWDKIDFSRFYFAKNDNGIAYYSEELGCYI